jgi:hypothetical protein
MMMKIVTRTMISMIRRMMMEKRVKKISMGCR